MNTIQASPEMASQYGDYYAAGTSQWRDIGAWAKGQNILEMTRGIAVDQTLEIGAGDGAVLQFLSEHGFADQLHAIEISPTGVDAIRSRKISKLASCQRFDGYEAPFSDNQFDLAILCHVLEHVEHERVLLKEMARVSKHQYIEVPLDYNRGLPFPDNRKSTLEHDKPLGHINAYSPALMRHLLDSLGFEILKESITNPPFAAYRYRKGALRGGISYAIKQCLLKISPALATKLFTYHYSVLCRPAG